MTQPRLADPPIPRLGSRRQAVLDCLSQATGGLGVADVAGLTGLHPNTARFHLDALVRDGLAERSVETRATPGRRRVLYTARVDSDGPRSYGLLAEMLTGLVCAADDPRGVATRTGRVWGRHLVERSAPSERIDAGEAVARLQRVFEEVGFQPETAVHGDVVEIRLRHCPFREVAQRHADVVCSVHLGMMQGVLDEVGGAVTPEALEPFVTPNLCIARLRSAAAVRG